MSLRALAGFAGFEIPEEGGPGPEVSIAFAIDRGYLDLWKVCIRSLAWSGNFLDSPLVLYTDDPEILDDPVVAAVVDRAVPISGARRARLHGLARTSVRERGRAAWNRGTFLKWAVFERHETGRVVFFDCDMLFLRRFDSQLVAAATAPFSCCPQFRAAITQDAEGAWLPEPARLRHLEDVLAGRFAGKFRTNVNSGMMVLGPELLSADFFDEITAHAARRREVNEQSHFTRYFLDRPEMLKMLPTVYNFQESYLMRVPWASQQRFLKRIHVLHYAGASKPWRDTPRRADFRPSMALWHWHRTLCEPLMRASA